MNQSPKVLNDAFEMAVETKKKTYVPPKALGVSALPVMPIDQEDDAAPTEETKTDLIAALEEAKS
jgi:hypothetical protein